MKAIKIALLGTAALAAASVGARAENLDSLKAQIQALSARVAANEAATAIPAGYSLVSFSKNDKGEHVISIMPSADAPAASASAVWSGKVRAAVVSTYSGGASGTYATNVLAKAGLSVTGKVDTAVGEVGAKISFLATDADADKSTKTGTHAGNSTLKGDGYSGWWKMTPNLTLEGGIGGTLAKSSQSFDAVCTCQFTDGEGWVGNNSSNTDDPAHIKLAYADGPLSFAVQVEDGNNYATENTSAFGVSSKASYSADMLSFDVEGGYWGNTRPDDGASTPVDTPESAWSVSGGIGASAGMFKVGAALGMGSGFYADDNWTKAGGYLTASLSESASLELGVTHRWNTQKTDTDFTELDAGLYYTPVKQLTLGVEGTYTSGGANDGAYGFGLASIFRF